MEKSERWIQKIFNLVDFVSGWSKDKTKVGCVITDCNFRVLSLGYNGFPQGCIDDIEERHKRPAKYLYTEHAERNAVYSAAKNGVSLQGSLAFILNGPPVC